MKELEGKRARGRHERGRATCCAATRRCARRSCPRWWRVVAGTCQGCNMNVPPQLYNTLRTTLGTDVCPSCNRIIYAVEALGDAGREVGRRARAMPLRTRTPSILRHIAREEPLDGDACGPSAGSPASGSAQLLEERAERWRPAPEPPTLPPRPAEERRPRRQRPRCASTRMARRAGTRAPAARARCWSSRGPGGGPAGQVPRATRPTTTPSTWGCCSACKRARELGVSEVEVFADSELMIRQLGGRYQVKSPSLRPLYEEALQLLERLLAG